MRTEFVHPIRVWKRLCVSVLGGKQSIYFSRFLKYFGIFGYFVKQNVILNIGFGFVVLNSIWFLNKKEKRHFFRKCSKQNVPEVWTILVRNTWGDNLGIFGPLHIQHTHTHTQQKAERPQGHPNESWVQFGWHTVDVRWGCATFRKYSRTSSISSKWKNDVHNFDVQSVFLDVSERRTQTVL